MLERITAERVALFSCVPTPGDNIPVAIKPFEVEDLVPEEEEIEWAVKRLCNNRSGGTLQMQEEHIKGWLAAAQRAEKGETADTEVGQEDTWEGA